MKTAPSYPSPPPLPGRVGNGSVWVHRCRLEVAPKTVGAKVNAASALMKVIKRLADAADAYDPIQFTSVTGKTFSPGKPPDTATFIADFGVVNVSGRHPKIVMGFTLKSATAFSTLKARADVDWMTSNGLYLRIHPMEFATGLDTVLLGYWTMEHPRTFSSEALIEKTHIQLQYAWDEWLERSNSDDISAVKKEHNTTEWFDDLELKIPMGMERANVKYQYGGLQKTTSVINLTVPRPALAFSKFLMDQALLHSKKLKHFIPFAYSKEDPVQFGKWVEKHDDFMFLHRNIQIHGVDGLTAYHSTIEVPDSLKNRLDANPEIHRVYPDFAHNRVNISVTESTIKTVIPWLDVLLKGTKFTRYANRYSSDSSTFTGAGASAKTGKYSAIFAFNSDDEEDTSTIKSAKSGARKSAWQRPAPITVICDLSEAAFPPMPAASVKPLQLPGTTATAALTIDNTTVTFDEATVDKRIDEAIAKYQQESAARIAQLEQKLDTEIQKLQEVLAANVNTTVDKIMGALTAPTTSPFATKADHISLQASLDRMSVMLTSLWTHMHPSGTGATPATNLQSPPRKKSNTSTDSDMTSQSFAGPSADGMDVDRPPASAEAGGGQK